MRKKMKMGTGDRIFYVVTRVLLAVFLVIVLYPIYFVVIASFSDSAYVNSGEFLFIPKALPCWDIHRSLRPRGYGSAI